MIQLSYWARDHRRSARLLLIACFLILYAAGFFIGTTLRDLQIQLGNYFHLSVLILFALFYFYYPSISQKIKQGKLHYYQKVISARLGITTCIFLLIIFAGNRPERLQPFSLIISEANAILPAKDSPSVKYSSPSTFRAQMKDANGKKLKLKERKKLLRHQIISIQHSNNSDGTKALLIALSIIIALGAFYGILVLSCALACSDMGVLAILVLLGGTTLLVFGLIKIIRKITQGKPKGN